MPWHPAQQRFLEDDHRFLLAAAGVQSGKTIVTAHKFARKLAETYNARVKHHPKGEFLNAWVVEPTYDLAKQPQRYLRKIWPQAEWSRRITSEVYGTCRPWPGCVVKFRSAEQPEKLVSEPVDAMWLNETARMKSDAWRGQLRMRLTATGGWAVFDTTPMGENWVYTDLYLPSLPPGHALHDSMIYNPDYSSHVWHTIDNPAVSEAEVNMARATLPAAYFNREYMADFSAFQGQIYEAFNTTHIVAASIAYPSVVLGVDWGFADDHPGAVCVVGIDRRASRACCYESIIKAKQTDDWWRQRIIELVGKYGVDRVWCDPSRPAIMEMLRRTLYAQHMGAKVLQADNKVWDGIAFLAGMFGRGSLTIVKGQDDLIRQLRNYHWEARSGTGETYERPHKMDDDGCDALRYAIASELRRKPLTYA